LLSRGVAKQWIMVTNKRIMFEAWVQQGDSDGAKFEHQFGSIPMAKVSYVAISTRHEHPCLPKKNQANSQNIVQDRYHGRIVDASFFYTPDNEKRLREIIVLGKLLIQQISPSSKAAESRRKPAA
jgi:hypothetical protein